MVNIKGESNVIHSKLQKCSSYAQGYKTQNTMTNIQRVEYRCTTNSTVFIATVTLLNPVNLQVDQTALLLFSAQIVEFNRHVDCKVPCTTICDVSQERFSKTVRAGSQYVQVV